MRDDHLRNGPDVEKDKRLQFTRRSILKAGGATALGGSSMVSVVRGLSSSTVKIPRYISGDEVTEHLEVPKDWNQQRLHASKVLNENRDRFEEIPGVRGTELGGLPRENSEKYTTLSTPTETDTSTPSTGEYGEYDPLRIYALTGERYEVGALPSEKDGITITTEPAPGGGPGCSGPGSSDNCTNHESGDVIQGGEDVGRTGFGDGTACCKVVFNGNESLLHCGHVFWTDCDDANSGGLENRDAEAEGERIGEVEEIDVNGDFSIIDNDFGGDYKWVIDDNNSFPAVNGIVSQSTIHAYAGGDSPNPCVNQMGCTTGRTVGHVYRAESSYTPNTPCTNLRNEGVRTRCNFGQGDSGGPTYEVTNNGAKLISVTSYYTSFSETVCGGNERGPQSTGISAYWIRNNRPVYFGG